MRVLVNTRLLIKNKLEGIGWFTFETFKRITQNNPNVEFIFLFDRPFHQDFVFGENVIPVKKGLPSRHPILWYLWFEKTVNSVINQYKPDVFVSPDGYLNLKTKTKQLAVIHDINFEHHPNWLPKTYSSYYRKNFPKFAQKATRIATVSEFSKHDISKQYNVNLNKIDVVYNGYNTNYTSLNKSKIQAARNEISGGKPYILFIGSIQPRKKLENQLKAFQLLNNKYPNEYKFVIVGESMWSNNLNIEIDAATKHNIIWMGRQTAEALKTIIGAAKLMSYVSLFEGFGIPILEGFSANIPVVTSTVTSMPEISNGAALEVNPENVNEIFEAYQKIMSNENLSLDLITKGNVRLKDFSWDKSAELLWQSIQKTHHAD